MRAIRFSFSVLFVGIFAGIPCAFGQTSQGRINGQVTDSSGGVVVAATITIENTATHLKRVLQTNSSGGYVAPGLEPGVYSITVEAAGFAKVVRGRIQIEVANDFKIDFVTRPGGLMETIVVKDEAPLTESANAVLSGVMSNKAINELPLQGRDFQNLLALHPGVQRTPGGGADSITSNGNRLETNNFIIDGATSNDAYWGDTVVGEPGVSGTPASFLPLDAITEFNTQESPQAEFGQRPGVIVNIGLKSGSNDIHGSAYYFHRNSAFDARNYFNPSPQPFSALLLHQFGASIGGRVIEDKWFYFANYEGIRSEVGNPFATDSPITAAITDPNCINAADVCLAAARQQTLDDGFTVSPVSDRIAQLFLPNPGFTQSGGLPQAINFDFSNVNRGDNVVFKSDYHPNSKHTLSARFFYANTNQTEVAGSPIRPEWLTRAIVYTQVFGADWTWTLSSRWNNQARFSYNRFWETVDSVDHNLDPKTAYGVDTGITDPKLFGFPGISFNDFDLMGGPAALPIWTTPSGTFAASDTFSLTAGKHALRFGGSYERGEVDLIRGNFARGLINFTTLENFFQGRARRGRLLIGDLNRNVHMTSWGAFINDDFRAARLFTFNLGLRYDVALPIKEDRNLIANVLPDRGVLQVGKGIDSPYQVNWKNISPRLSAAWDVFGTGNTVLRAGGGLIFVQPGIRTFVNGRGLNLNPSAVAGVLPGNGTINTFLRSLSPSDINFSGNGPIFDVPGITSSAFCSSNPADDNSCDLFAVDPRLKAPYVTNWTVNLQQVLSSSTMLQVAYVGNHGTKLYSRKGINEANRTATRQCLLDNAGENIVDAVFDADFTFCEQANRPLVTNCITGAGRCLPFVEFLTFLGNDAKSSYHALQVTLSKRYSRGLYLVAGYTYGHAIDNATFNLASVPQNSLNYQADRGNGDYDIRHRFTLSATYDIPSIKSKWQMFEGWQATSIVTFEGGEPVTFGDSVDDLSLTGEGSDRWNINGRISDIHWTRNASPSNCNPAVQLCFIDPSNFVLDDSRTRLVSGDQRCTSVAAEPVLLADFGCYVQGSAILTPPAAGTFGDLGRNTFHGPALKNWDFSLSKAWRIRESLKLQIRGEFFNVVNHPNFDRNSILTDMTERTGLGHVRATPDVGVDNPVIGSGGSRHIQLGLKFIW